MFTLDSITAFFRAHGSLRLSQRKTLAALVWAVTAQPRLGVAIIGRSLTMAGGTTAKHNIKRVDRFLGNPRIDLPTAQGDLIATLTEAASEVLLTLDWTDPKDGVHQILACNLRAHGRALPVGWITLRKDALKGQMRATEIALCQRVATLIPPTCHVILLADRGFASTELFRAVDTLQWDWIIRSKGTVRIQVKGQPWTPLSLWSQSRPVHADLPAVHYGRQGHGGAYPCRIVVYGDVGHPDPWYLIVSAGITPAAWPWPRVVAAYGQRFTTEECFKDQKNDPYEGFHLDCVTLGTPERWNRLLLIFAWAYYWLNVAGWQMETTDQAHRWRANTAKKRTHALWRLGHWCLEHHDVVWRTLLRARLSFIRGIPPLRPVIPTTS